MTAERKFKKCRVFTDAVLDHIFDSERSEGATGFYGDVNFLIFFFSFP